MLFYANDILQLYLTADRWFLDKRGSISLSLCLSFANDLSYFYFSVFFIFRYTLFGDGGI